MLAESEPASSCSIRPDVPNGGDPRGFLIKLGFSGAVLILTFYLQILLFNLFYEKMSHAGPSGLSRADRRPIPPDPALHTEKLSPWPALTLPTSLNIQDGWEEQWLNYQAPPELRMITIDSPVEAVQMVYHSTHKERHLRSMLQDNSAPERAREAQSNSRMRRDPSTERSGGDVSPVAVRDDPSFSSRNRGLSSSRFVRILKVLEKSKGYYRFRKTLSRGKDAKELGRGWKATSECASCFEDILVKHSIALRCQHKYCVTCFSQLVLTAMQTEALFPPKCCLEEIPLRTIMSRLKSDQREKFKSKAAEYAVPTEDRWYCPSTKCGIWIPPNKVKSQRTSPKCPHCRILMCPVCRGRAHPRDQDCPQEFGLQETLQEAELQGWRRCYKCRALVELTLGCQHITCVCGAEFCYTCGSEWKICNCTQDDQIHRQEQLAALRSAQNAREAEAEQEQAEIAAAVAAVEEMETRETERQIREEEERRRQQRLSMEWDMRRLVEIGERMGAIQNSLLAINKLQQNALLDRQRMQEKRLKSELQLHEANFELAQRTLTEKLQQNQKSRLQSLNIDHTTAMNQLEQDSQKKEKELVVKLNRSLGRYSDSLDALSLNNDSIKGKVEERKIGILTHFRETQVVERELMRKEYELALKDLEHKALIESRGLRHGMQHRREREKEEDLNAVRTFFEIVSVERIWFDKVVAKRQELAEQYSAELVAGQRSLGQLVVFSPAGVPPT